MSILVDNDILIAMERGEIVIDPFDRGCLGTNSYDVHLRAELRVYTDHETPLDVDKPRRTRDVPIPNGGLILEPGELYLASTVEHTESHAHVPVLNGRSSIGRLGLSIHVTAGTGDVGFCGMWTMELFVIKRLRIRAGIPIAQLLWFTASSAPAVPYYRKPSAKYRGAGPLPQPSLLHQELSRESED